MHHVWCVTIISFEGVAMNSRGLLFSTEAIAAAVILILAISVVSLSTAPSNPVTLGSHGVVNDRALMAFYHHEAAIPLSPTASNSRYCRSAFYVNKDTHTLVAINNVTALTPGVVCQ